MNDDDLTGAPPLAKPRLSIGRGRLVGMAVFGLIVAGLAGIYVSGVWRSNGDPACAPALAAAKALAPLAKGEVAAFQPAEHPFSVKDLTFQNDTGETLDFGAFRGKSVLLNFWATWCVPCRAEMPALDRLAAARAGADFAVVAIDLDTSASANPKKFLSEIGVTHLPYYADQSTASYGVLRDSGHAVGLPTTLLIDANGCALGVMSGPAAWDSRDAGALIQAAIGAGSAPKG